MQDTLHITQIRNTTHYNTQRNAHQLAVVKVELRDVSDRQEDCLSGWQIANRGTEHSGLISLLLEKVSA